MMRTVFYSAADSSTCKVYICVAPLCAFAYVPDALRRSLSNRFSHVDLLLRHLLQTNNRINMLYIYMKKGAYTQKAALLHRAHLHNLYRDIRDRRRPDKNPMESCKFHFLYMRAPVCKFYPLLSFEVL